MDAPDSTPQENSGQTWSEALAEYERWLNQQASAIRWTRRVLFALWIWWITFNLDVHVGFKIFGILVLVGLSFLPKPKKQAKNIPLDVGPDLESRISTSGLVKKICSGSLNSDEIIKNTFPAFRWLVPKLTGERADLLKRVGASLEWYLIPPAQHYRKSWTLGIWCSSGALLLVCLSLFEGMAFILAAPSLHLSIGFFAFLNSVEIDTQFEGARTLIENLKEQREHNWDSAETTKDLVHDDHHSISHLHRGYNIDLVINNCDKVLDHYKQQPLMTTFMVIPFLLLPVLLQLQWLKQPSTIIVACITILIVSVTVIVRIWKYLERKSAELIREYELRLKTTNLATKILIGSATKAQLKAHMPRPLRMLPDGIGAAKLPSGEGAEISADIVCVALNLDWYLENPKPLFRPIWITGSIQFVVSIGFLIFTFSTGFPGSQEFLAWIMLGTSGFVYWISFLHSSVRMRAGSLALIEHLREGRK